MTITTSIQSRRPADKRTARAAAAGQPGRRPAAELQAASGPLPGQIERVIVTLQNDGRLPIRIPPETMRHVAESLARYFQTASADKIEQFAEAAKAAVEAELKTINVQTHDTMKADTTGVNVGATPATSRGVLTSFIESATGDNIGGLMNMDFFNRIMREVTQGAGNFVAQNFDQTRLDEFPALELHRVYDREVPRGFRRGKGGDIVPDPDNDWPSRWEAAGGELVDGRMVALKSDPIWKAIGDGEGGYEDTLGNPFAPFAFNSGFDTDEVSREDAVALGLMDDEDQAQPADFDFRSLLDIDAASAAGRWALEAGDVAGHEFHGNQWTNVLIKKTLEKHGIPISRSTGGGRIAGSSGQSEGVEVFQKGSNLSTEYKEPTPWGRDATQSEDYHTHIRTVVSTHTTGGQKPTPIERLNEIHDRAVKHLESKGAILTKVGDREHRIENSRFIQKTTLQQRNGKSWRKSRTWKEFVNDGIDSRRATFSHPLEAASGDVPLVAKCFIADADGRLLVLQADGYGRMDLPGGHLQAGETVEDGLRREVLEETGLTLTDVKELGTVLVPWNGQQPIVFFTAQSEGSPVLSDEHVDWFWMNKHEVALRNFSALNKVVNNFTDGKDLNEA